MGAIVLSEQEWEEVKGHIEGCAIEHDGEYSGHPCSRHGKYIDTTMNEKCGALCAACGHDCASHVDINQKGFSVCVEEGRCCLSFKAGADP